MSPNRFNNVLSWATDLDENTIQQASRTADLPFVKGHLALMPDAHLGYGATIGSVIPTRGAIIPSAVGVDIGCGMVAIQFPFTSKHLPDDLGGIHSKISSSIPAGVGQGHDEALHGLMNVSEWKVDLSDKEAKKAMEQLGSLGSGNHFVEICLDETDTVWAVLHSGSRGIGNQLAQKHIDAAKFLMKSYFIELEDPDLAYLVEGTDQFNEYISAMHWAQDYALLNRKLMADAVIAIMRETVGSDFTVARYINCHHNFTQMEHHNGQNLWITRKGAIKAAAGDLGVIPGSMGTRSYIVSGLGNDASYHSCSHGAGRTMSRNQAKRELDIAGLHEQMAGKSWDSHNAAKLIDEDPRAYKDIDVVMENQRDLVKIEHTLSQILNYKGV